MKKQQIYNIVYFSLFTLFLFPLNCAVLFPLATNYLPQNYFLLCFNPFNPCC